MTLDLAMISRIGHQKHRPQKKKQLNRISSKTRTLRVPADIVKKTEK